MNSESLASCLISLIGADKVTTREEILTEHSGDQWSATHLPDIVVFAESTADVSAVLKFSNQNKIPVTTRGAG